MPNWCSVDMQIEGPRERVVELVRAATSGVELSEHDGMPSGLLSVMVPIEGDKTVSSQRAEWGTKWDVTDAFVLEESELDEGRMRACLAFDTAWSPPVEAVETFLGENADFDIRMQYLEPGVAFVGEYTPEGGEATFDFASATRETVSKLVPQHIVEHWDLEEALEEP